MVLSGSKSGKRDTPEEVALDTLTVLMEDVPSADSWHRISFRRTNSDQATENLAAITKRAKEVSAPWPLTFSYARALQEEALAIWKGKEENIPAARAHSSRASPVSPAPPATQQPLEPMWDVVRPT